MATLAPRTGRGAGVLTMVWVSSVKTAPFTGSVSKVDLTSNGIDVGLLGLKNGNVVSVFSKGISPLGTWTNVCSIKRADSVIGVTKYTKSIRLVFAKLVNLRLWNVEDISKTRAEVGVVSRSSIPERLLKR
jgi:hypothetical protein